MNSKKDVFCDFGWQAHLPAEFQDRSQAYWLAHFRRKGFPNYFKAVNQQSKPYFKKEEISQFFLSNFGILYPSAYENLIASGFPEVTIPKGSFPKTTMPRRRRGNAQRGRAEPNIPLRQSERTRTPRKDKKVPRDAK